MVKEDYEIWTRANQTTVWEAGLLLNNRVDESESALSFQPSRYWNALIQEIYNLLCTQDPKYKVQDLN